MSPGTGLGLRERRVPAVAERAVALAAHQAAVLRTRRHAAHPGVVVCREAGGRQLAQIGANSGMELLVLSGVRRHYRLVAFDCAEPCETNVCVHM